MSAPTEQSAYTLAKQIVDLAASKPDSLYDDVSKLLEQWHEVVYKRGHEAGVLAGMQSAYFGLVPTESTEKDC